jgi:polyhydroxyalkanoate synthase subunit PhaE
MSESPFWNDDWMRTQRNYWEQWSEMSRKAMGMERPAKSPWESAMEHWWKAISPGADRQTQHFMEKMLDQGKLFFRLGDEVSRNLDGAKDWSDALTQTFEKMQGQFAAAAEQGSNAGKQGFEQMAGFWEGPMESWRKAAGQLPLNDELAGTPKLFEQLLGMPGLGYTREDEERYKALANGWMQYQHALARYNHFFADVGTASLRCMQEEIKQLKENGGKIDSGRALYDTWVGACEKVYAEHTMTPEYAKVHGELVNALMAFKKQWRELQDQRLGMLGMPTRREIQTLQCRLQDSRRELRALRTEVELLRDQLGELRAPKPTEPAPSSTPKATVKKVAKKKVARKKAVSK